MTIGLDKYRDLVDTRGNLANRRVTDVKGDQGQTVDIQAPHSLRGRIVNHVRRSDIDPGTAQDNREARATFQSALTKAYSAEFANGVIKDTLGLEEKQFRQKPKDLQAHHVKLVLDTAEERSAGFRASNARDAEAFIEDGGLARLAKARAEARGFPDNIDFEDAQLKSVFRDTVRSDRGFALEEFGQGAGGGELDRLAGEAVDKWLDARNRKIDQQYPHIAHIVPQHKSSGIYALDEMVKGLAKPPFIADDPNDDGGVDKQVRASLAAAIHTLKYNDRTFGADTDRAGKDQRLVVFKNIKKELERLDDIQGFTDSRDPGYVKAREWRQALSAELSQQIVLRQAQLGGDRQAKKDDALSEKNVAYDDMIWAETSQMALQEIVDQLRSETPKDIDRQSMTSGEKRSADALERAEDQLRAAKLRSEEARNSWLKASDERRDPDGAGKIEKRRKRELTYLREALTHAKVKPDRTSSTLLDETHRKVLETAHERTTIERDMLFTRDGVSRAYRSVLTPGNALPGEGPHRHDAYDPDLSVSDRETIRLARNLQVSDLRRRETDGQGRDADVIVSRVIHEPVTDAWNLERDDRRQVLKGGAEHVLRMGVELSGDFRKEAIERAKALRDDAPDGDDAPDPPLPCRIVHVNFNRMPDFARKTSDRAVERALAISEDQFEAYDALEGRKTFTLKDGDDDIDVPFEVSTVSFSFGVEGPGGEALIRTEDRRWDEVLEHDRSNMEKLFGDLDAGVPPGGHLGEVRRRLREVADRQDATPQQVAAVNRFLDRLQKEVDLARNLFASGDYRTSRDSAQQLMQVISSVTSLGAEALSAFGETGMLISQSRGGLDTGDPMVDVELKSQLVIRDMGGEMTRPGDRLSEVDQSVFDTVLGRSGQLESMRQTTGATMGIMVDERGRFIDPDLKRRMGIDLD